MNENHSAITRLMYQLFIALGKKSVSASGQYSVSLSNAVRTCKLLCQDTL